MVKSGELARLDVAELLRRGIASARVGESLEAQAYLDEVIRREPENADAWLWLASVAKSPAAKRGHFERVLALRPGDADAEAGLARLSGRHGASPAAAEDEVGPLHCTWHPDRETLLRCNRCGRPMCTACAVRHPVGLRCKECIRESRSPLYRVSAVGYVVGSVVAIGLGTAAAWVAERLGRLPLMWLVALFVGTAVGTGIAELVSRAAGRKRGRDLQIVAASGMILGAALAGALGGGGLAVVGLFGSPAVLVYLLFGVSAAVNRLR